MTVARWLSELLGAPLTALEPATPARSAARSLREASVDGRGAAPELETWLEVSVRLTVPYDGAYLLVR
jgi:hypothetical protein